MGISQISIGQVRWSSDMSDESRWRRNWSPTSLPDASDKMTIGQVRWPLDMSDGTGGAEELESDGLVRWLGQVLSIGQVR